MFNRGYLKINPPRLILILLLFAGTLCAYGDQGDFIIDGVYPASVDLPRILFILKREPSGPPLEYNGSFQATWAFLDTGASGIVLSRETRDDMVISVDPVAEFVDFGVGGAQSFDVSEPLYIGTAEFNSPYPLNLDIYDLSGPWRFQMTREYATGLFEQPLDILGIPVMAGKTVVLDAGATNDLDYFNADIKEPNDPTIPQVDFQVPLRFERYIHYSDSWNTPPEPILAYNPVIDNITIDHGAVRTQGTWLVDTGAMLSIISVEQGVLLGLTDSDGIPVITPDFEVTVGGVGDPVDIPGFYVDQLRIPTLSGYHLAFINAPLAVHDIGLYDEANDEYIIIDGIFGSNFLAATWNMDLTNLDIKFTPFDWIVLDTQNALLGFDVDASYPLPECGDAEHPYPVGDLNIDCKVNLFDIVHLLNYWLRADCVPQNDYCQRADISKNNIVNLSDYALLAAQWQYRVFPLTCGSAEHPWPMGDFNRNCSVNLEDLAILDDEWQNQCDWLNWNCRGADLDHNGIVNNDDLNIFNNIK